MSENSIHQKLRETFFPANRESWKQIASQELDGKSPDETLSWNSEDGVSFSGYYDVEDDLKNKISEKFRLTVADDGYFGPAKWLNVPRITITSETHANEIALQHLTNGADGVIFKLVHDVAVQTLLKDIDWKYCSLFFHVKDVKNFQHQLFANAFIQQLPLNSLSGGFFWDTIPNSEIFNLENSSLKNIITIPARTSVLEIVHALVSGLEAIDTSENKPWFAKSIGFSLEVNQHFLESIAKLKSLRLLWFQVMRAFGHHDYEVGDLMVHARSEAWISDKFQPHGNMLKGTTAGMAAVIGGADVITIIPEDELNSTMIRSARNISNLLREESYFDKVADPTAGAYAIDSMVAAISKEAWRTFQEKQKQ